MGTIANQLITAFRDFVRFTGDGLPGEPVGRPLPQGDPASGQFNPPKKQVREALLAIAGAADDLNGAVLSAAGSAEAAAQSLVEANDVVNNFFWYIGESSTFVTVGVGEGVILSDPGPGPYDTVTLEVA
ncbi:hypothetical protein DSM110277_02016 [Sulfitobacter pontiacus]|uniref:Uncharacterized protein n=1 Tax=Sulfitobacter pontiacus TaxID=60137 RepID=A0AAX3ABX9_9RHOB|nr:hypothetical protein [Sulfitobacter pontiacus]UOA23587.1 hypothetical protein DSM110277_02016 [Sulfitobacter pontiacus]